MTFEEWRKANPVKCKTCSKVLNSYMHMHRIRDLNSERLKGFYCKDCVDDAQQQLKEERFVEEYKGNEIYCRDGCYAPYWGCAYYLKSLDECRLIIDSSNTSTVPILGGSII